MKKFESAGHLSKQLPVCRYITPWFWRFAMRASMDAEEAAPYQ